MAGTSPRHVRVTALLLLLAVLVGAAACGGAEPAANATTDDGGTAQPASDDRAVATDDGAARDDGGACTDTQLTFTNHETGVSGTATAALATDEVDGGLYVAHVADFAIDPEHLQSWRPEVPEGNNVITILFTVYNREGDPDRPQVGDTLQWGSEMNVLTYVVRHFTTDQDWSNVEVTGAAIDDTGGDLTVTATGEQFCFEIDYQDPSKSVSGTVAARTF